MNMFIVIFGWFMCFGFAVTNVIVGNYDQVSIWTAACIIISTICFSRD